MNNLLNKVKIENTFRINASSALEAAKASVPSHLKVQSAAPVFGCRLEFVITSTMGDTTFNDVVFVELVSPGKYRVESGSVSLSDVELAFVIGGDDAVNEIGVYIEARNDKAVTVTEYEKELAFWIAHDVEESTLGRMESHIKNAYKKVTIVNGKFEEVK